MSEAEAKKVAEVTDDDDLQVYEIVEEIFMRLVDYPDDVLVREVKGQFTTVLEVTVNKRDIGKAMGKQGRYASALRMLLGPIGRQEGKRYELFFTHDQS